MPAEPARRSLRAYRCGDLGVEAATTRVRPQARRQPSKQPPRSAALRQGDLDGLCGVYAIINALCWLCPAIDKSIAARLFQRLLKAISPRSPKSALRSVTDGLSFFGLARLLRIAIAFIDEALGLRIGAQPLVTGKQNQSLTLAQLWRQFGSHFDDGGVAIIGLGGFYGHWTVAVGVTPRQLEVFDSGGLKRIRRRRCTTGHAVTRISINPVQVILLAAS